MVLKPNFSSFLECLFCTGFTVPPTRTLNLKKSPEQQTNMKVTHHWQTAKTQTCLSIRAVVWGLNRENLQRHLMG